MAMKITGADNQNGHSLAVDQNEHAGSRRAARQNGDKGRQLKNGSINMSGLNGGMDSVLTRSQLLKKRAMKVVSDAWEGDKKIDDDIANRRNHIKELNADIEEYMKFVDDCNARKAELKEMYGVGDDNEVQKDLALLRKRDQSLEDPSIMLTEEEQARLNEIHETKLTEYQERVAEIYKQSSVFEKDIEDAKKEIIIETVSIQEIQKERLKHHEMVDAQKEADEINAEASREIIGELTGEAKDHIEETQEEQWEEAKERAEEKEEQEEKLEERKAEKEQQQEQLEIRQEENRAEEANSAEKRREAREQADLLGDAIERAVVPSTGTSEAKIAIKEMLHEMKMLEEDLKGIKVDDTV